MEEDPVAGVQEQRPRRDQRGAAPERECSPSPAHDRRCVQGGHERLRRVTAREVERATDEERRERRPEEHRHRQHRVPLEHLDVEAEIRSEVASRHDGQRDALEAVHGQRDEEEQGGSSPRLDAALEAT